MGFTLGARNTYPTASLVATETLRLVVKNLEEGLTVFGFSISLSVNRYSFATGSVVSASHHLADNDTLLE
jgi:hypothetical protein